MSSINAALLCETIPFPQPPAEISSTGIHLLQPTILFKVGYNGAELYPAFLFFFLTAPMLMLWRGEAAKLRTAAGEHLQVLWKKAVGAVDSAGDASPRPAIHAEHGRSCCKTMS